MSDRQHVLPGWQDPPDLVRRQSRVDAYMPWSSLESLAPTAKAAEQAGVVEPRRAAVLPGGCRLYRLPTARSRKLPL